MATADLGEELKCSICLACYQDPVSLKCGHNFCRGCIQKSWNSQSEVGVYSCPYCREVYLKRPKLKSNYTLSSVVRCYLSTKAKMDEATVFCTYCLDSPSQAVKLCLQCETHLCEIHLQKHNERLNHFLAEPTTPLESRRCSVHKELLKCYCADDDAYLCVSCCMVKPHKNHTVQLLCEASGNRKAALQDSLKKLSVQSDKTERKVDLLEEYRRALGEEMTRVKANTSTLFSDIRELLENKEKEFLENVTAIETNTLTQITHHIQEQQNKKMLIAETMLHLKELCNLTDPLTLLEESKLLEIHEDGSDNSENDEEEDEGDMHVGEGYAKDLMYEDDNILMILVTLQSILNAVIEKIPELKEKRGIRLTGAANIILDVDTIGKRPGMLVSQDLRSVSHSHTPTFSWKSDMFEDCFQVLGAIDFSSGQHYWEVETSATGIWAVGVSYTSIERVGVQSSLGYNNKSWCLEWNTQGLTACHNSEAADLECNIFPKKLGVYLDFDSGILSFYHVSGFVKHLYTFNAVFTEPLQPAFCVDDEGWLRIRSLQC